MSIAFTIERLSLRDAPKLLRFLQVLDDQTGRFFQIHTFDIWHVRSLLQGPVVAFQAVIPDAERTMAGYGWLSEMDTDHPEIWGGVDPRWRGQGIGRALMNRLIEEAVLRSKRELRLSLDAGNAPALHLARSLGFAAESAHDTTLRLPLPTSVADRARTIRRRLEGARVSIIPYCHADWAWVHTRNWHRHRYALVFEEVLRILREDASFRWYFDNYACQLSAVLELRPDLVPELRERIRQGQVAICGGYANVRPQMVGNETFVRNLVLGRRAFGALFPEADLTVHADGVDVATGHPQLPQILSRAGYRYLRIWRPYAAMSLKGVPNEFVWRGMDGSEILTSRGLYGGQWHIAEEHRALGDFLQADWDAVVAAFWDSEIEERARYSASRQIWVAHGSDDARPGRMLDDTPFDIRGLVRLWNGREPIPMRFATPVEQFAALEEERGLLPRIEGTLDPCDVAYNAAWNGEKGLAVRRVQNDRLLTQAEIFCALAELCGLACPESELESLWKDHLLTCAHATQWLYADDFAHIARRADRVEIRAEAIRDTALDRLVESLDLPSDVLCVVANPLPCPCRVPVTVHLSRYGDVWPLVLGDGQGNPLDGQVLQEYSGQGGFPEQRVIAMVRLPPLGIAVVSEMPSAKGYESSSRTSEMDNGRLRLIFSGNRITAIADSVSGRVWQAPPGGEWGGPVVQDVAVREGPLHVGPLTGGRACLWESGAILEGGPVRWRWRRHGQIGDLPAVLDTFLYAEEPYLSFELSLDWPGHDGFLSVRMPLLEDGTLHGDIPFGMEVKNLEEEPYGADHRVSPHSMERTRKGMFYARSFVACDSPEGYGFAFVSGNTDRYYLWNREDGLLEHILINSVLSQDAWEAQVEQSTLTGRGEHRFRYHLLVYEGNWRTAEVVRQATALREEPLVREALRSQARPSPVLKPDVALLSVEPANVMLSALYREGSSLYMRLYETAGEATEATIQLPRAPGSVEAVDLIGDPEGSTPVSWAGQTITVSLSPWKICTLRVGAYE